MKAQASLEFLMTYGWAILVVLIAITAFSFIAVVKPQTFISERCILNLPLFCEDAHLDSTTGDLVLRIRNSLSDDISINEIELQEDSCYILILRHTLENKIAQNSEKDFILDCDFKKGQKINSEIKIKYAESGLPEGLEKISKGELIGKVI